MLNGQGEENMYPVLISSYHEQILMQLLIPFQILNWHLVYPSLHELETTPVHVLKDQQYNDQ